MVSKILMLVGVVALAACYKAPAHLSADDCEIVKAALPDFHASPAETPVVNYLSDAVTPRQDLPRLSVILETRFALWEVSEDCLNDRSANSCLKLIQEHQLDPKDWPEDAATGANGTLTQCQSIDFGPEITKLDWQSLTGQTVTPNVSPLNLFEIERIITSTDGLRAIVTMQYTCGGLCAEGYSLLLEKSSSGWNVIGKQPHWVS